MQSALRNKPEELSVPPSTPWDESGPVEMKKVEEEGRGAVAKRPDLGIRKRRASRGGLDREREGSGVSLVENTSGKRNGDPTKTSRDGGPAGERVSTVGGWYGVTKEETLSHANCPGKRKTKPCLLLGTRSFREEEEGTGRTDKTKKRTLFNQFIGEEESRKERHSQKTFFALNLASKSYSQKNVGNEREGGKKDLGEAETMR